jgi:hypothetical protein
MPNANFYQAYKMAKQGASSPYVVFKRIEGQYNLLTLEEKKAVGLDLATLFKNRKTLGRDIIIDVSDSKHFYSLFKAFLSNGQKNNWIWNGNPLNTGNWGTLLDGTSKEADCDVFCAALIKLAKLPPPYGLLLTEPITPKSYSGKYNQGFVVNESRIRSFGHRCAVNNVLNVFPPNSPPSSGAAASFSAATAAPTASSPALDASLVQQTDRSNELTLWMSHTAVFYQGKFWDPCYGSLYDNNAEFVDYEITGENNVQNYYSAEDSQGREFYFLKSLPRLIRTSYIGPLTLQEMNNRINEHIQAGTSSGQANILNNLIENHY